MEINILGNTIYMFFKLPVDMKLGNHQNDRYTSFLTVCRMTHLSFIALKKRWRKLRKSPMGMFTGVCVYW